MAAKTYTHGLPQYVTPVKKNGKNIGYKYQRRVPKALHDDLGQSVWDLYLGADLLTAMIKAKEYCDHHDLIIAKLSDTVSRSDIIRNGLSSFAADKIEAARQDNTAKAPEWRETESYLRTSAELPDKMELEALAVFAATAFGDRSYIETAKLSPAFAQLAMIEATTPPSGGLDLNMWTALKSALDARLSELQVTRAVPPNETVTARMNEYITFKNVAPNTARNYRLRIKRLVRFVGRDIALADIDALLLRAYRDHLANGDKDYSPLSNTAIRQYFYPLKSLFRWCMKEDYISEDPTARVNLPEAEKSIEEARWQAFNDIEIATVWKAIQEAWGTHGTARLEADRRAAFLMAFRVLLWTGLRPNEVFKLKAAQVESDRIRITRTKTGAARTIPLANAIADFHDVIQTDSWQKVAALHNPAGKMSNSFTATIRAAGLTNDRHVLYSLKDTMLDRLESLGASENIQRSIIGHVTGRGALRNYKTAASVEQMREFLDRVFYCAGLP